MRRVIPSTTQIIANVWTQRLRQQKKTANGALMLQSLRENGRVLVGEGVLTKMCRKKSKPRQVFLFNDILVYGNILIPKKKYIKQNIIPLEKVWYVVLQWLCSQPDSHALRSSHGGERAHRSCVPQIFNNAISSSPAAWRISKTRPIWRTDGWFELLQSLSSCTRLPELRSNNGRVISTRASTSCSKKVRIEKNIAVAVVAAAVVVWVSLRFWIFWGPRV